MKVTVYVVALLLGASGCEQQVREQFSCERGTSTIAIAYGGRQSPDRLAEGEGVQRELGRPYLYIAADCSYSAWLPTGDNGGGWAPTRSGYLLDEEVDEINRDLWQLDLGAEPGVHSGLLDAGWQEVWTGDRYNACHADCSRAPAQLEAAVLVVRALLERVYARGADLDGPMRVFLHRLDDPSLEELFPFSEWSGELALADLAVERGEQTGQEFGNHHLVTGEPVDELRAIRDRHIRDGFLRSYGFLPISDEGELYFAWGRDSIPGEDDAGLIAWPDI